MEHHLHVNLLELPTVELWQSLGIRRAFYAGRRGLCCSRTHATCRTHLLRDTRGNGGKKAPDETQRKTTEQPWKNLEIGILISHLKLSGSAFRDFVAPRLMQ